MNDRTQLEPSPPPTLPRVGILTPGNLEEALAFAAHLAKSELVPKDYRDKPANVLVAIQWGFELGIQPMQSLSSIAVINGRASIWGDLGKAMLLARGYRIQIDDFPVIKAKGQATCTITSPRGEVTTRTFTREMAVAAKLWSKEGPWTQYPERQMAWRAFWFAARDAAADVLRGIPGAEENADLPPEREVNPPPKVEMPQAKGAPVDAEVVKPADEERGASGTAPQEPAAPEKPLNGDGAAERPMSEPQVRILRARMRQAAVTDLDVMGKFGKLEDLKYGQFEEVQAWIAERAKLAG